MSWIPHHLCSAKIDPAVRDEACITIASRHQEPLFRDAFAKHEILPGSGKGKSVFLFDAEVELFKQALPRWIQHRGTCVMQGSGRAMQYSILWEIAFGNLIGKKAFQLAPELIYASRYGKMSRSHDWGCRCGSCPDGNYPGTVSVHMHAVGLLERGMYNSIDLTKPREDLAILWANIGMPAALVAESKSHLAGACYLAKSVDEVRDGIAAGYGAAGSANLCTRNVRDANGMCGTQSCLGHCQVFNAVFEDYKGRLCFGEGQSWEGEAAPHGGGPWQLSDGRKVQPPEGTGGIFADDMEKYVRQGEVWLYAAPEDLWKGDMKPSEVA